MASTEQIEEAIKEIVSRVVASDGRDTVTIGDLIRDQIMYERERCAKIAEAGNLRCGSCRVDPQGCECPDTSKLIAKKIRDPRTNP